MINLYLYLLLHNAMQTKEALFVYKASGVFAQLKLSDSIGILAF